MKEDQEVITEFNEYVNVTASELDKWLKSDDSSKAGWHKDGGDGESVGQESGHKIVEILKTNPNKDPEKYTDDQIQHMRKVASYCKRHLAQETKGLKEKDEEEAKKTKSYISLMNWGHDPLRAFGKEGSKSGKSGSKSNSGNPGKQKAEVEDDENDEEEEKDNDKAEDDGKKAGDKRKKPTQQNGANKKRETRQTRSSTKNQGQEEEEEEEEEEQDDEGDQDDSGDKSSKKGPKKGDTVSWNWGSGHPHGVVLDVKDGDATITTKRGNEVSRKGKPEDPAVILDAGKSKAIKLAHELN